mgnify:CR=1 FL=1
MSLKYSPLNPPNTSMQLPTNTAECLRLALGNSPLTFNDLMLSLPGSITSMSCRSLLKRPPKMYIFPSKTVDECPQRVRKELPFILISFHSSLSPVAPCSHSRRSMLQISLRQRYLPWQPPITKKILPITTEVWNRRAQGFAPPYFTFISHHCSVYRLNAQRSSKSASPSPPNTIRYGYNNYEEW